MDGSKWKQAWAELKPLLHREPRNPSIRWVAGLLQAELGHPDQALAHLRFAAEHIQDEPDLFQRLGELEQAQGDTVAAQRAYERALAMETNVPRLLAFCGILEAKGLRLRAIETLEQAYALDRNNHQVALKLAFLHQACFEPTPALKWAMRAVELKQDHWDSYLLLATILQRLGHLQEAVEVYHSLLLVRPDYPKVNQNLGVLCVRLGLNTQAIRYLERAAEVETNRLDLDCNVVHQKLYVSDWADLGPRVTRVLQRLHESTDTVDPFGILSVPEASALDLKLAAERTCQALTRSIKTQGQDFARPVTPGEAERRLRIGYMSCDFHEHATAFLMARLFELHDRSRFQLHAYSWDNEQGSTLRQRVASAFEVFRDIRGLADQQAAELIHQDQIDILVDLKGHTRDGRLPILAHRPAPVQVHHVGFPGTLGAPFVDYLVADRFVVPPEHAEHFTEKLAYLPDCYQPTDESRQIGPRPAREACGLPANGVVFCCFNQVYKIIPEVFDLWCRLLREVPDSVLWLLLWSNTSAENLRREAEGRGVDPVRLVSAPPLKQAEHLGRLQNADIVLDTLPVNAHTTASDAVWAGVPVVTLPGEPFVSRVAGSIITTLGLPELVARDSEDYFRIARELALHPAHLDQVKARVREGCRTSPLFDSARYTRHLEALYRAMWRRRALGLAPETVDVTGEVG
jgi:predicted O-linked N-acetylglucosamine transferase (SPINDLY family)